MPLELREILMIVGVLIVIVLIFDGIRRMRNASPRYQQKKYDKEKIDVQEPGFDHELPNGGARVISKDMDLQEDVPVLVESFEQVAAPFEEEISTEQMSLNVDATQIQHDPMEDVLLADCAQQEPQLLNDTAAVETATELEEQKTTDVNSDKSASTSKQPTYNEIEANKQPVQEVLVINVMANTAQGLQGETLLELLLACGLRFGEMNIFHRYDDQSHTQFSVVNCVKPGIFNLEKMHNFTTPGVSLFMQLPMRADAMQAFDFMYETALCLAKNLDAQLKDEQQSSLTAQTAEHYREKIRSFKQSQLMQES